MKLRISLFLIVILILFVIFACSDPGLWGLLDKQDEIFAHPPEQTPIPVIIPTPEPTELPTPAPTSTPGLPNRIPQAGDDTASTLEDTAIDIDVLANDTDPDGDTLVISAVDPGQHGLTAITMGLISYTPYTNFYGVDTFSYTVSDGNGGSDSAVITITITGVNDDPGAVNDTAITSENNSIDIDVLANDTDPEGDTLTIDNAEDATNGSTLIVMGLIRYTPDNGFNGTDNFIYTVTDGNGGSDSALVTITVTGINDFPLAQNDSITTNEDTAVDIDVLANDSDTDGDPLTIASVGTPSNGTTAININQITYTPALNFFGTDSFSYTISDGNGGTDTATVSVTINGINDDPVAANDARTINEDTQIDIDVRANDTDIDGDTLTISSVTPASHGTTAVVSGLIRYTPDPGYNGSDSFSYTIDDGNGGSDSATVTLTISPLNDNPIAVNDTALTNEDTAVTINVLGNDTDPENDILTIASVGAASNGTTEINMGQITYTPHANFYGTDTFSYTASDGNGGTDSASVTVTITAINDNPVALDDSITTNEDTAVDIDVLANDSDIDGDIVNIASVGPASNGTAVIDAGRITYTPDPGYHGVDSFTYTVSDGNGGSDTATVTVTISSLNDNPVAANDTATTNEDTAVNIDVLANDSDIDGDILNIASVGAASHGTAVINAGQITYTPAGNFFGSDSFTYTVNDGNGGSDIGTVTVTITGINDNPVALNDSRTTNEDISVDIDVLSNDSDIDADILTIISVSTPSNGTATINAGRITYTPDPGFNGIDTFTYTISDGNGGSDTATVTVSISALNDNPVAQNDTAATNEDISVSINVLANDSDIDGDPLTIASTGNGTHGSTAINMGQITYTPDTNYNGTDSFSYTVSDGNGGSDTATVTVTINPVNDNPVAENDSITVNEDDQVDIDVMANDSDVDGDSLTITIVGTPSDGSAVLNLGQITYTPDPGFNGTDSFTYTISDGNGGSDSATVTVTISSLNDNPVAVNDSAITDEDTLVSINVLANDSDIDGDTLTLASAGTAPNGTTAITLGQITYTPNANFNGSDSFSYTVSDGHGGSDTATVTVTINPVNDNPVAGNDSVITNEDTQIAINVLNNDSDVDGDIISITSVGTAADGTAVINMDQIIYTPDADFNGTDTFSYTIGDGHGGTDTATVTVTVSSLNDNPVAQNDTAATDEDTPISIDVLANDTDSDGDTLTIASVSIAPKGITAINMGQILYTPNANFFGSDTFTYTVSDGNGGSAAASVTVTITGVNDAPVAVNDSITTNEDTAVDINVLANDSDIDGDSLTIASVGSASNGSTEINMGLITYTPNPAFNGTDTFSYTVSDGNGGSDTATVTVTISSLNDNPVAVDDTASTNEDTAADIDVLSNDTDVDGDTLSISSVGPASHGTAVIDVDRIAYTPDPDYFGTDTFSYTVSDGNGGSDTAIVTITINAINDDPVAADDSTTTNEETMATIPVLANDTDVEGDSLSISSVGTATHGTTGILGNQVTYTPEINFTGSDSFSYTVSDGNGGFDTATVTVTVNGVNDDPVAANDSAVTDEETQINIDVLDNDSDADGDTLTIGSVGAASHGTASINIDQIRYTPNPNFNGTDSFSYTISDGNGGTDTATVTVTVNPVNDNPTAVDDTTSTNEETMVTINVLANDSDVDGDSLSISNVGAAPHGTASINLNQIRYTPDADFNGTDSFSYTISDGNGGTATATITVTVNSVNDNPVAINDSGTTNEDTQTTIDVLINDSDIDGDTITISSVANPPHGTAVITMGQIQYTPDANYYGTDSFSYTISDGNGGTDTALIVMTINAVNDNPAAINDSTTTNEETQIFINVLANDTDADGDTLSIAGVGTTPNALTEIITGQIRYTPDTDYYGIDTFTYTISDGNGGSDTATVTITVNGINDDPVAVNDTDTTDEDTAVTSDVLANDSDADGDTLSIASVGSAAHGTTEIIAGQIRYTPAANYFGTDSYMYTTSDGNGGTDIASVTITITGINDNPIGVNDSTTTNEETLVYINVLSNDSDPDNDTLTIASVGSAAHGTTVITMDQIRYTPAANFFGIDSFSYTVSDGNGGSNTATVTVTVNGVNDNPIAANDSTTTNEDSQVDIDVLGNDTDVDGDTLSIANAGTASNGTTAIIMGQIRYTPNANFSGTDSFMYTVSDGNGGTDTATVTITITGINDNPVAFNDSATTNEETQVLINVLANDTDVDGDTLSIASAGTASNGITAIITGQIRYTPNTNFYGTDTFSYTVSDGNGGSDTATVTVTVNGVNDDPVAVDDSAVTNEESQVTIDVLNNDTDADADSLSIAGVGTASHGTTVITLGQIQYTPDTNYNGTDTFSYSVSDGNGGTDTATVTVTINGVNDNPVAVNDSGTVNEDSQTYVDVLNNDTDIDGDTLSIDSVGSASHGTAVSTMGQIRYTPAANYNGTDTFTYTVSDGQGGTDNATVTITINPVNDNPVAIDDSATTNEDSSTTIDVLSNDSDVDGDSLTIAGVGAASNGNAVISAGMIDYTPNAGYFGTDSFSYTVSDGNGGTDTGSVTVTIIEIPDPTPVAGLLVQYKCDNTDPFNNVIGPNLRIVNNDVQDYALSDLTMRYYYTKEVAGNEVFFINWATIGGENITGTIYSGYAEIGFTPGAGTLTIGSNTGEMQIVIHEDNWGNYDETDDYSFDNTISAFTDWDKVTLYYLGTLVWGIDPDGETPTPDSTPDPTPDPTADPAVTPTPLTTLIPGDKHVIYDDTLNDWVDDSYLCTPNYSASLTTYEGNASIEYNMSQPFCELSLDRTGASVDMSAYTHLAFYVHGGSVGGQIIDVTLGDESNTQMGVAAHLDFYVENGSIAPDEWRIVEVPIEAFNAGSNLCGYINFINNLSGTQSPVYIDYIQFVNNPSGPTPIPTPGGITPEPTLGPTGFTTNGLLVQYRCGEALDFNNHIKPHFTIRNTSTNNYPLSEITIRYYYTKEGISDEVSFIDYSTPAGSGSILINFGYDVSSIYRYMEIGFTGSAGTLNSGSTQTIESRFNKIDWTDYNEVDDYSYDPSKTSYTDWDRVTLYYQGTLVWGTEPDGTIPSGSPYVAIAPISKSLYVSYAGSTLAPTSILTPEAGLFIGYTYGNTNPAKNQIQPNTIIFNTGSTNVVGQFIAGYLEKGFTTGAGDLSAGSNSGEIQLRFNKSDWSNYDQNGDYSFNPAKTG